MQPSSHGGERRPHPNAAAVWVTLIGLLAAGAADASLYHATDFGWTAGQDVSTSFAALMGSGTLGTGDELVLDHVYRIGGTHQLPDGFTLSAEYGAGFDVVDADQHHDFLRMGHATVLRNLTIRYLDTPPLGPTGGANPQHGIHFFDKAGIVVSGKTDARIEHCRLSGSIAHHIRTSGTERFALTGSHLEGGFWTVYMGGNNTDAVFRHTVWEQCQGDGIKTVRGGDGTQRALVDRCVFQDCGRDGIDTTGGWKSASKSTGKIYLVLISASLHAGKCKVC
ncbi:MAG: right-handed parallel beta-helix repeat-containing protein [Phycisphaerae bacterium]|nr:right-handed parallel beta-helix repeat-containing protein [Phycisphaerae bacterium]